MADDNLDGRLARIEAALSTLVTKTEGIETDITRLAELGAAQLAESRKTRDEIRDLRDQFFVQGGILVRLEQRDRDADATTLALQHQIQRLERRIERLEQRD